MSSSYNSQRCYSSSSLSTERMTDPSWSQNSRELRGRSNRSHPSGRLYSRVRSSTSNTPISPSTSGSPITNNSYDPFVERMTRSGSNLLPGDPSYVHIDYRPGTNVGFDASSTSLVGSIDKDMQKKLVDACMRGDVDVTDRLIRLGANPNYSNDEGTLKPSVYYASRYGHFHLLVRLIERHNCNAHYKTPRGTTLLHLACLHGHDDIVKYLTSSSIRLDPSARNRLGSTPLHLACVGGHPHIVQYLIENLHCDPRCVGEPDEETPLHTACTKGHLGIMKYLIEVQKCDPFHPTRVGETPLHLACQHGHKDIVVYLITEQKCDPMVQDLRQNTPLHSAAQQNHPDIVYYLIMEQGCNPYARNKENCTPLHLACRYSRINVVKVLLEKAKISASITGPNGQTPIQMAYDYDVVKNLIRHGANPKEAQVNIFPNIPPQQVEDTIVRILVVGDPSSGKSTLVEALKTQPKGFLGMPPRGRITDVEPYTAGIIPHDIKNNPEFGHVLLFDFAGHSEYYSSHSVVIDSVCASPPIFIVVVDLSKDEERIKLRLHFWIQFIENNRPSFVSKPHIVVVGSHDDVLSSYSDINYKQRMIANIRKFAKEVIESTSLQFAGFFHINCQKVATQTDLRQVLAKSCRSVRAHIQDDNLCHAFSVYLIAMFNGRIMVTLREIADVVRQSDSAFPFEYEKLCKLCESLGTKVNVMFIRNPKNMRESTVILEVNLLLSKIHGVMFAPQGFKEHKLNSQNGIVTFSRLKKVFKGMDPRVIAQCMQRLEFCQEVQDSSILNLIRGRPITTALSPISPDDENERDGFDEYYFFPCLIDTEHPHKIWSRDSSVDPQFCYYTGWCLQVCEDMQMFPARFLHSLLLRLAFNFAVASDDLATSGRVLNRACNLWKNGIHWFSLTGTETYVELREDSQVLVLVMRCLKEHEMECVNLRAAVIQKILETKATFIPNVMTSEGLLDPSCLVEYPLNSIKHIEVPLYHVSMVLKPLLERMTSTFDRSYQHTITLDRLLYWDPYMNLGKNLLEELFNPALENVEVNDSFIEEFSRKVSNWEPLAYNVFRLDKGVIDNISNYTNLSSTLTCQHIFEVCRSRELMTYGRLRNLLDSFSIFGGRDMFELSKRRC